MPLSQTVLQDIIQATHCHSCGKTAHVSLIGYAGKFCDKTCWRIIDDSSQYVVVGRRTMEDFNRLLCDDHGFTYEKAVEVFGDEICVYRPFICRFGSRDCEHSVSLANDNYMGRVWEDSQSASGKAWPMCSPKKPCYNECIMTKEPIDVGRVESSD